MVWVVGGARVEGDGHHAVRIVAAGMDLPAVDDLDRPRGPAAVGFTFGEDAKRSLAVGVHAPRGVVFSAGDGVF